MRQIELGKSVELVTKGTTPTSLGKKFTQRGVRFLRAQNVINGKVLINDDILFIDNETHDSELKRSHIKKGDVLLTIAGTIGRTAIVEIEEELNCNQAVAIIRLGNSQIYPNFLCHFFSSNNAQTQFTMGKVTATIPNLSLSQIKKLKIPLPLLDQQKKIAAILDAADAYRQKTKALITKYDALTQSLFLDMFGDPVSNPKSWEVTKIGNVCSLQGGYTFKSKDFVNDGIRLVKIGNVHFEDLVWNEVDMLPEDYLEKHSNFSLNEGDVLIALTRPIIKSLGTVKAVTVKLSDLPCLLNQRVARFVTDEEKMHKRYLLGYIYGSYFKNKIEKYSSTSLQPNVSNKQIEEIKIMLPPLELQNQFAERVQAIEAQKVKAQDSLVKAENLFNSLLQKAFKGELVS